MSTRLRADAEDESGATLLMVIGFVVIVAFMSSAVLSLLTAGATTRVALDEARNVQYAADGAIERAIAQVRTRMQTNPSAPCPPGGISYLAADLPNDTVDMQVDCTYVPSYTLSALFQRNVVFVACEDQSGSNPCGSAAVISAQVNFQSQHSIVSSPITITKTFIQSWSVNR